MLVAKSEKTNEGNTVVIYWDSHSKKYNLSDTDNPDHTTSSGMVLESSHALQVFDRLVKKSY